MIFLKNIKQDKCIEANCSLVIMTVLMQYGLMRTATTFQTNVLLATMVLLNYENATEKIRIQFGAVRNDRGIIVSKTHSRRDWLAIRSRKKDSLLFITKRKGTTITPEIKRDACYVQGYEDLVDRKLNILRDYQEIFDLSENQYLYLREYMRYFQIYRQCCGDESSIDNMHILRAQNRDYREEMNMTVHESKDLDYPDCNIYNLSNVEKKLESTIVMQKIRNLQRRNLYENTLEARFKGVGSCLRENAAITQRHLGINRRIDGRLKKYKPGTL